MKRTVRFLDQDRKLVVATCEITERNGYPEFTMCGQYSGGSGQVFDEVKPANDKQGELIKLWKQWHLNSIPEDFEDSLNTLLDEIEEIEEERKDESVTDDDYRLFSEFDDPVTALALAMICDLTVNEIDDIKEEGNNRWCVQGVDYLAGTDADMDVLWDEDLDNYLEECVYPDLPDTMRRYFDDEAWKRDARMDGRGHSLGRYDGNELEMHVKYFDEELGVNVDEYIYAYKQ